DYLNLLKWTEPVALMLALVEYETPLRVVQLALDVDLMLGARLAGEVKSEFQEKTVGLVLGLNVTHEVKFYLLGLTRSQQALSLLLEAWNSKDSKKNYGYAIAEALTYVGCDEAMSTIIKWEDEQIESWNKAAQYEDWDNYLLREKIISELASIASSNIAIYKLVTSLNDKNFITLEGSDFYRKGRNYKAKEVLGDKVFEQAISFLLQVLNNEDLYIRYCAASALGKIGSEAEVIDLTKAVKDENYFVRYSVTKALGKIGSSKAISALLKAVSDEKSFVRYQAVEALGKIDDERGINALIKALKDEEPDIRRIAAQTLGNKGIYLAINALVRTLKDEKSSVSSTARYALLNIRKSLVEDRLWNIFSYSDIENVIFESDDFSKTSAVYKKLYNIYNKCLQDVLDDHSFLKKYKELSVYLNSNTSLIEAELKYQIWEVILNANFEPKSMIIKIQEQCLFYNYNIFHSPPVEDDKNSDTPVKTILILAANPKNTSQLRLDEEVREIDEGLRRANKRDLFWLEQKWAVRERDFYRAILDTQPQIIHFCGHGEEEDGIVLEDETGQKALVNADTLASIFNLFATKGFATKGVECVVLNACYSQVQAEAISQHINYVIGMSSSIGDKAAIKFAVAFYDALGAGEGVESAFKLGCSQLVALKEHQTPVLKKRLIERAPPQES
nr:HEAT repeat domain-containing protein [Calothrix sp. MO_167.B42]